MNFSEVANDVMLERRNFSAPDCMKNKEPIDSSTLKGQKIVIDTIVISNRIAKDKDTKEPITNKNGEPCYNPVVFVAFNSNKYFACKSAILARQIEKVCNKTFVENNKIDHNIDELNGLTVLVGTEDVTYRDKKTYPNIIFKDA